ncbi:beta-carotene hydroxylase [Sphingomonas ginkgonis]|uniref:Beta-carotene hydroxylase n=1 Tax=Sphingomonas ginkgonis TaxID=2315330 RepID=A0A429VCC0_9SPHN|nr:sterol desaturase family protein [Sphingomonas ginkgonis]RST31482.1 beta-carotene hydroxylase [Sphingomonas ginkgonis]
MSTLYGILLFGATVAFMEAFAYGMHRWVMHGRLGWLLHASHHRERHGPFELNDLYAVIFAAPSIALIWMGTTGGWGPPAVWIGAGIAVYGAIYFGFHDIIVHRRIAHRVVPRSRYFKRIVQAHRLHHAVETREGTVSFGFIYAPPVERLKALLRKGDRSGVRAPKGGSTDLHD